MCTAHHVVSPQLETSLSGSPLTPKQMQMIRPNPVAALHASSWSLEPAKATRRHPGPRRWPASPASQVEVSAFQGKAAAQHTCAARRSHESVSIIGRISAGVERVHGQGVGSASHSRVIGRLC